MLGPFSPSHAESIVSLVASTSRDCVLVSSCGAMLEVPGLLLALYSPLLAPLLAKGQGGVSLPLPLPEVRGLMRLLQGEVGQDELQEVEEAAELLGITILHRGNDKLVPDTMPRALKQEVIPTSEGVTMKEEKKGVKMKPLKMTLHEAEDLLRRVKMKTVVKED